LNNIFYLNIQNNEVHSYDCWKNKLYQYIIIYEKDIYKNNKFNINCPCMCFYKNISNIKKNCNLYNLNYYVLNDIVSIKTKVSDWKIIVPTHIKQKTKLLHSNFLYYRNSKHYNNNKQDYHIQFIKHISMQDLIKYIALHDNKYGIS